MLTQLKIHAMAAGRLELETGRLQDAGMFEKAVALYEPINAYKPIADGIGTVDGPLVSMAYPGFPFLSIPFPTRMTVVRLGDGALWLHSPVAYDEGLARDLSEKGRIAHLVSPNLIHYAHIGEWSKRFPKPRFGHRRACASARGRKASISGSTPSSGGTRRQHGPASSPRR